jgi:UDP-N-acetylglucosamine diphosphorylase / glucose-1-phosphate thymidylyltransferase / UDP-N-acetylgalactosamine diphosphorylase / glucosamine-1-phosphate N-acetyltransferase / galactosamine-1-phosphate N-acetyltransferase
MPPRVIVYEDPGWQKLLPLVFVRAAFQLLCGTTDLVSRVRRLVAAGAESHAGNGQAPAVEAWCRPLLADVVGQQTQLPVNHGVTGPALLLNGRGVWQSLPAIEPGESAWVGTAGPNKRIACLWADATLAPQLTSEILLDELKTRALLAGLPRRDVSSHVALLDWPWQIVNANEGLLRSDWSDDMTGVAGTVGDGSYLVNERGIHIGWGTKIKPCVVIDAEDGPVWIGDNVTIYPHSYIQGPAWIGNGTLIQPGATVHAGTTIGPRSKIGGEIEASIVQGLSNKQHDGFLGHSYVGSWVNIAADCINSDLKNTYGRIRVPINGRDVETGEMFVGMFVGDYSKAGINVSFPTGAVIGFCSSVFAARSPKFVPSFAWLDGDSVQRYDEERGLAIARKVMARRQCTMSPAEEQLFLAVRQQALAVEKQTLLSTD